jgi:hypothetical protein
MARLSTIGAAVLFAASSTAAGVGSSTVNAAESDSEACSPTRIHTSPLSSQFQGIPWIAAKPASSHVRGVLFYRRQQPDGSFAELHTGGVMPDGGATKILWLITSRNTGRTLTVKGINHSTPDSMRQTFPRAGEVGQYPSILNIPSPGCWTLTLQSGKVRAKVTLPVVADYPLVSRARSGAPRRYPLAGAGRWLPRPRGHVPRQ